MLTKPTCLVNMCSQKYKVYIPLARFFFTFKRRYSVKFIIVYDEQGKDSKIAMNYRPKGHRRLGRRLERIFD